MTNLQTIGDPEMPVNKVLILVGGGSLGLGVEEMPMQAMEQTHADVMLCGDVTEWTTCAYIAAGEPGGFVRNDKVHTFGSSFADHLYRCQKCNGIPLTSCWGSPVISWSQVGAIRVSPVESVRTRSITS